MRTRPSVSEEDSDTSKTPTTSQTRHGDKLAAGSVNSVRSARDEGQAKERRRNNDSGVKSSSTSAAASWNTPQRPANSRIDRASDQGYASKDISEDAMAEDSNRKRTRWRDPWACSRLTFFTALIAGAMIFTMARSFLSRQLDPKGCAMSYMRPSFVHYTNFDTEHTRFASKYSLYLYREGVIDEDPKLKGVPVLFIPGNAGSYKQVRPLAAEAAYLWHDHLRHNAENLNSGKRPLDFFSVDFNEDITAFHGQTLLDQAEYLNDAILYILSLYHDPAQANRDLDLPDPSSVIIIGHSMGGIVARTMLITPNYQSNSINTIITLSAPHARPPVSFDSDIVQAYKNVNDYWRQSYSHTWANDNPLWHVTLISIAGGGLDTIVPSDYASVASLVPPTHGFTVFTSTIPEVWTGADHLAITWCNQVRKSVVRALYDIIDVHRGVQTRTRTERMTVFRKRFLTGLEDVAEKTVSRQGKAGHNKVLDDQVNDTTPGTLLTVDYEANSIISPGQRLVLRMLGKVSKPKMHLLPVPDQVPVEGRRFTLLTDRSLDQPGSHDRLEVLFCSIPALGPAQSVDGFDININVSGDNNAVTRLVCKNAATDTILLPASTREARHPFEGQPPFSYLQYELEQLADYQFVAVVEKPAEHFSGWLFAEFRSNRDSAISSDVSLQRLATEGLRLQLPRNRPLVVDVKIPALQSSLMAYKLRYGKRTCAEDAELFTPLLRQYISDVYESKFFVNVKEANINLHGVAPYMPPRFMARSFSEGLALQLWSDPTCESTAELELELDMIGSMGKLWMRYRIVFAAFPILVVALVLRKQFKIWDETGIFMSFSESLNQCIKTSLPVLIMALTFFSVSVARADGLIPKAAPNWLAKRWAGNATESLVDYTKNDLLLGFQDPLFWFLIPLFATICTGICIGLNFVTLALTHVFAVIYGQTGHVPLKSNDGRRTTNGFSVTSTPRRILTTSVLLALISTVIPYHFAYVILCVVQLVTCIRAYRLALDTRSESNFHFYNYTHTILILMLWILPINIPVLVVWIRNLTIHWLTPFSSHHNILSVTPFLLLVETLSTGRMVPRVTSRVRYLTNIFLFCLAVYAAVYGVTYAYVLHYLANVLCAWLVVIHFTASSFSTREFSKQGVDGKEGKKRP